MIRTYKYRLYPNANQTRELESALETHRRLYNHCLESKQLAWECFKANISYFDFCRWFAVARKGNRYYASLNSGSARTVFQRLDRAFDAFFRRAKSGESPGYPRFKGKDHWNSIGFQGDGYRVIGNRLRVQHIGKIKIKLHRPIGGKIKTMTLCREAGKWFACFSCELPDVPLKETGRPAVGVDVGIASFIATSDGGTEPNPAYLKSALPELRRAGRAVSRKKRGGANRRKSVKKLQKVHVRVRNLRREHHHQVACKLIRRYGFIAVESLNIQGMVRNRRLSRAIHDAAWGGFVQVLKCKAESAGIQVVEVPAAGTSQECSGCGENVPKDLSVRQHDCPHCGLSLDRDVNAARNILARARQVRIAPAHDNVGHKVKRRAKTTP